MPSDEERMASAAMRRAYGVLKSPGVDQTDPSSCTWSTTAPAMSRVAKRCRSAQRPPTRDRTRFFATSANFASAATGTRAVPAHISACQRASNPLSHASSAAELGLPLRRRRCARVAPLRAPACFAPPPCRTAPAASATLPRSATSPMASRAPRPRQRAGAQDFL